MEKQQGKNQCDANQSQVKGNLHHAEIPSLYLGDSPHNAFAGDNYHSGSYLNTDTDGQNHATDSQAGQTQRPGNRIEPLKQQYPHIDKAAENAKSIIKCDTILLDKHSKSDTIPTNIVDNPTSYLEHEATVSKLDEEKLFYLMSRGLNEDRAKELLIIGFIDEFRENLPMEYAVELNALLKNYF